MAKMKWTGAELNRRHTAFQAVALPSELPVHIAYCFWNVSSSRQSELSALMPRISETF